MLSAPRPFYKRFWLPGTVAVLGVVFIAAGAVYALSLSPWLVWELLPAETPLRVVLRSEAFHQYAALLTDGRTESFPEVRLLPAFRVVGYSRADAGEVLVGVPHVLRNRAVVQTLRLSGWEVRRLGHFVYAERPAHRAANVPSWREFARVVQAAAGHHFSQHWPLYPALIAYADADTLPFAVPPTHIVGEQNAQQIISYATWHEQSLPARADFSHIEQPVLDDRAAWVISIPGTVLSQLPAATVAAWEDYLHANLAFQYTAPVHLQQLPSPTQLAVVEQAGAVGLAVHGNAETLSTLFRQAIAQEEAYYRPVTRAFQLPDGTLGYEKVPGALEPALADVPDESGCFAPTTATMPLWLCRTGQGAALGASQEVAVAALEQAAAGGWQAALHSEHFPAVPAPIQALQARGDHSRAIIVVETVPAEAK